MVLTIGISWTARLRAPEPPLTSDPAPAVAGAYVVDVADAAWSRNERMVGRWIVELTPDGTMEILPPDSFLGGRDGISYQINGDRLRTNAFVNSLCDATATTSQVGTYRWTLTATTLRITAINDSCHTRRMFFTAPVWLESSDLGNRSSPSADRLVLGRARTGPVAHRVWAGRRRHQP